MCHLTFKGSFSSWKEKGWVPGFFVRVTKMNITYINTYRHIYVYIYTYIIFFNFILHVPLLVVILHAFFHIYNYLQCLSILTIIVIYYAGLDSLM